MKGTPPQTIPPTAPEIGAGLRRYLYFTAGAAGAAIMVVEILGAKMLSPYFGTSHFVWTAQIVVTLLALAGGYYLGGRLVDRSGNLSRLYACILLAAIYLCSTVLVVAALCYQCLQLPLAAGSLLASLVLFFPPLTLLAVTGPFLVRVLSSSLETVGGQTGRLSAVGTLGSVAGTLLIGYVVIPYLPNSVTMAITGGSMAAVAAVYFLAWGRRSAGRDIAGVGVVLALAAGASGVMQDAQAQYVGVEEVFRANSNFGELQLMKRNDGCLVYLNDFLTQDGYDTKRKQSLFAFTYVLHGLARAYEPKLERVLCIGVGTGVVPMEFATEGARVDAVEINPAVVTMAEKYLDFDRSKIDLHIADGRQWLNGYAGKKYDAVILDAFLGDSTPWHLMTRESFQAMSRAMNPDGVLVINAFCSFEQGKDFFGASLYKTLKAVFKSVRIHRQFGGNTYFVASNRESLEMQSSLDIAQVHPESRGGVLAAGYPVDLDLPGGMVLTDDYNPAEYYDAPNQEILRRSLALQMKRR